MVSGAGAGGRVAAAGAAGVGARVAIIEEHLMGGDCLNVGCIPSKALIRCAKAAHEVFPADACGTYSQSAMRIVTNSDNSDNLQGC